MVQIQSKVKQLQIQITPKTLNLFLAEHLPLKGGFKTSPVVSAIHSSYIVSLSLQHAMQFFLTKKAHLISTLTHALEE